MASTKALFVLAVLLASAVLLTTAAPAEQTHDKEEKVSTNSAGIQDGWRGGGGGGYPGHGGGGYGPVHCGRWGCCRRGYHGNCMRCCGANEKAPVEEVHN
ncbi:glycine-rich cell wall structural protein [Brachypodium distachyon]|uniref:Glycine-rich protein n=1 Tax=Brachypodium distachyon TaxID=15368 RepID=I1IB18_BRADI|nr:glycine-rich cell wall structural protein [Brachypodium distachyon]KQK00087.1 hypothetical protein BRADI_3g47290v3 [Brachypodium distachyon]|eukprot:XP_010235613.1 glycine-rich cell wall structural protein [Brachypodium distachyon]